MNLYEVQELYYATKQAFGYTGMAALRFVLE